MQQADSVGTRARPRSTCLYQVAVPSTGFSRALGAIPYIGQTSKNTIFDFKLFIIVVDSRHAQKAINVYKKH